MKTLTIRGLPDKAHARLKRQATSNRRSLNQEVIAELCKTEKSKVSFVEKMLSLSDEVYAGVSTPLSPEEIQEARDEMRNR